MLFLTLNTGAQCLHSFRNIGQLPTQTCGGPAAGLRSRMLQVSCGEQQVSVPHNTQHAHAHACTPQEMSILYRRQVQPGGQAAWWLSRNDGIYSRGLGLRQAGSVPDPQASSFLDLCLSRLLEMDRHLADVSSC